MLHRPLFLLFMFLLSLASDTVAAAIDIQGVRVWRAPEYTRFVFDVSGTVDAQVLTDVAPGRVIIDFRDAVLKASLDTIDLKDSPVRRLRSGLQPDGSLRIVLDLGVAVRVNHFRLAPSEPYGHRLVVDLFDLAPAVTTASPEPVSGDPVTPPPAQATQHPQTDQNARPGLPPQPAPPIVPVPSPPAPLAGATVRPVIVAIDAGHGGEDPGAIGPNRTREKDVVLAIARAVRDQMREVPGLKPVLIRDGDYYIGLRERRTLARKRHNADIFISIHADAFNRRAARGASVFAVSRRGATSTLAAYLADSENRADLVGGVDPRAQDDVMSVISDLMLEGTMTHSLHVGSAVLSEMGSFARLHKPRVEQAGFMVLKEPNMPSILIETGFISNPEEERLLRTEAYQQRLAHAITRGVQGYFERYPPPGTWFAANREGLTVAAIEPAVLSDADAAPPIPAPTSEAVPTVPNATAPRSTRPESPPRAATAVPKFVMHKVTRGQSLGYIAKKYGVTQAAIKKANNLRRNDVFIGETLKVPPP